MLRYRLDGYGFDAGTDAMCVRNRSAVAQCVKFSDVFVNQWSRMTNVGFQMGSDINNNDYDDNNKNSPKPRKPNTFFYMLLRVFFFHSKFCNKKNLYINRYHT